MEACAALSGAQVELMIVCQDLFDMPVKASSAQQGSCRYKLPLCFLPIERAPQD